jgi:hypothetical protein
MARSARPPQFPDRSPITGIPPALIPMSPMPLLYQGKRGHPKAAKTRKVEPVR